MSWKTKLIFTYYLIHDVRKTRKALQSVQLGNDYFRLGIISVDIIIYLMALTVTSVDCELISNRLHL